MTEAAPTPIGDFRLGDWLVQPSLNRISRGGSTVSLELKMMAVLVCLAEHPGELVTRQDLIDTVWAIEYISEKTLTRAIAELRRALGDDARQPSYIETIHRRGYRLLATPSPVSDEESSASRTLSHYLLLEHLGGGGMGVVYRAEDTKLRREVALKFLSKALTHDPDARKRFMREARAVSVLDHLNICTIHEIDETPDGQLFIVMAYYEGESLKQKIDRGPVPVDEALRIGREIAEGLEPAHEAGIIHRDLKPANVMITSDGVTKIVDFGLAKLRTQTQELETAAETGTLETSAGTVVGTVAYMSPEQATGRVVDKKTDIWAFGCVVYQMLTGFRPFSGTTTTETLAAIIRDDPDWEALPSETPTPIRRLLRRCLTKDPRNRLHDIADARLEIEQAITGSNWASTEQAGQPEPTFRDRVRAAWPVASVAFVVGTLLAITVWRLSGFPSIDIGRQARVVLSLPPGVTIDTVGAQPVLAMSPDDRWLVFVGTKDGRSQLYRRDLEQFDAIPIPGTEGAEQPSFSSDGRWVGYFADGRLKKVPLAGGPPRIVTEAPKPNGMSWGPDGTIVFIRRFGEGLCRVPSAGGTPEVLATPDFERGDSWFLWPESLPDGRSVLFTNNRGFTTDDAQIEILDLESRARKTVIKAGSCARYVPTGHLVFGHGAGIHVAPFDAERREVTGPSIPVPEPIFYDFENGIPHLALSTTGSLAFVPVGSTLRRQLVSVDLEGRETPLIEGRRGFAYPRFSPDGERLAVTISEPGDTNIWILNLSTGTRAKLTLEGSNNFPVWTPDGERVTFHSRRGGVGGIYWKRADGSGESEPLVLAGKVGETIVPQSWTPDGNTLVFQRLFGTEAGIRSDLWIATREGDREPLPLMVTGALEAGPAVSPDGRWLAYKSNESGRYEIYVQPFPGGGERHQISTDGALPPVWSPDGQAIFYQTEEQVLTARVSTIGSLRAEAPRVLFKAVYDSGNYHTHPNFDVAPDGKSFVMVKADESWGRATEIRVVLNWFEELKRLAPAE